MPARADDPQIPADDPRIERLGRWTDDARCDWTGSALRFRTDAGSIVLHWMGKGFWTVAVNGQEQHVFQLTSTDPTAFTVNLPDAGVEKTVVLFRRSEASSGLSRFLGLDLPPGAALLPPAPHPPTRRLLVVGDSISCGYGNLEPDVNAPFSHAKEDGYHTYWAIAARELGLEPTCIAWSGRGLWANRGEKEPPHSNTLPVLYDRVLGSNPKSPSANPQVADIIVINLGTNDSARKDFDPEAFRKTGQDFLNRLRSESPNADIFLAVGPLVKDANRGHILREYTALAGTHPRARVFDFGIADGAADYGGHFHPSKALHEKMARTLAEAIRSL